MSKILKIVLAILTLTMLAGLFYWFSYRDVRVSEECTRSAANSVEIPAGGSVTAVTERVSDFSNRAFGKDESFDKAFYRCLRSHGVWLD